MSGFSLQWDPTLISLQIIVVTTFYYLILLSLLFAIDQVSVAVVDVWCWRALARCVLSALMPLTFEARFPFSSPTMFPRFLLCWMLCCIHFCSFCLFFFCPSQALQETQTLHQIFSPRVVEFHSNLGRCVIVVQLIHAVLM